MRATSFVVFAALLLISAADTARADYASAERAFHRGDFDTAIAALTPLAEKGDPRAQYRLGGLLLMRADMRGLPWVRNSAEAGYVSAQVAMAGMYMHGMFTPLDPAQTLAWVRKAARPLRDEEARAHLYQATRARCSRGSRWRACYPTLGGQGSGAFRLPL